MSPEARTQSLAAIEQQNRLLAAAGEGFQDRSVTFFLDISALFQRLEQEVGTLVDLIHQDLPARASALRCEDRFQGIGAELREIGVQCQGRGEESWTLRQLVDKVASWREGFLAFLTDLDKLEVQRVAESAFLGRIERIDSLISRGRCLAPFQEHWKLCREAARTAMDEQRDEGQWEMALAPFADQWKSASLGFSEMLIHYAGEADIPEPPDDTLNPSLWLERRLPEIFASVEDLCGNLLQKTQGLPPIPASQSWLRPPVTECAAYIELRLASARALLTGPVKVLQDIAVLMNGAGASLGEWIGEYSSTIGSLLERSMADREFLLAIEIVSELLGHNADLLDQMLTSLVAPIAKDPLWRLPQSQTERASRSRGATLMSAALGRVGVLPPLSTVLHIQAYADGPAQWQDSWPRLTALGSFGGWLLGALLDQSQISLTEDLARVHFSTAGGDLNAGALYPVAVLTSTMPTGDDDFWLLLSALEAISPPAISPSFRASWITINRLGAKFPQVCLQLRLRAERSEASSTSSARTQLTAADERVRDLLRRKNYHNIRCLNEVAANFQRDIVNDLFERSRNLQSDREADPLRETIRRHRADLKSTITGQVRSYAHHEDHGYLQTMIRDLDEMLNAITDYLDAAKQEGYQESPGLVISNRERLRAEVESLAGQSWCSRQAARLFDALLLERKPVLGPSELPGDVSTLSSETWFFPRCRLLWQAGTWQPDRYTESLTEDILGPNAATYALSLASNGDIETAGEILRSLPAQAPATVQETYTQHRAEWSEMISRERELLQQECAGLELTAEDHQTLVAIEEHALAQRFDLAFEHILQLHDEVKSPARLGAQIFKRIVRVRKAIRDVRPELLRLANSEERAWSVVSDLVLLEKDLPDQDLAVALDEPELKNLETRWQLLEQRIADLTDHVPALPSKPSAPDAPEPTKPKVEQPPDSQIFFGVVKRVYGTNAGFITPFHPEYFPKGDLYYRRTDISGSSGQQLRVGSAVLIEKIVDAGYPQLSAEKFSEVPASRIPDMEAAVAQYFGHAPENVGVTSQVDDRRVIFTATRGVFSEAAGGPYLPLQVPVLYELVESAGQTYARVADRVDLTALDPRRRQLLERLAQSRRPSPGVLTAESFQGRSFQREMLLQVNPATTLAIPTIREIRRLVEATNAQCELYDALAALERQPHPHALWLQAGLLSPYLTGARLRGNSAPDILTALIERRQQWWFGNLDGILHDVYDALVDLTEQASIESAIDSTPIDLSLAYRLFQGLQADLGAAPSYRIEIILCRLCLLQAEDWTTPDVLRQARVHAERAHVLHPRLSEAEDILRLVEAQERRFDFPIPAMQSDFDSRPSATELPADPVMAIATIASFYRQQSVGTLAQAKERFRKWRTSGIQGRPLGELFLEHARLLRTCLQAQEAQDLLIEYVVGEEVLDWEKVLAALFEVWTALQLPLDRVTEQAVPLRPRVPAEHQFVFDLLCARLAYAQHKYGDAKSYADASRTSRQTPEAEQLFRQASFMLGEQPQDLLKDPAGRRQEAWRLLQQAAAINRNDHALLADVILAQMDDAEVGPWLVKAAVLERDIFDLGKSERRRLCDRAADHLGARDSVDLFWARVEIHGEQIPEYAEEGVDRPSQSRIESLVDRELLHSILAEEPSVPQLEQLESSFGSTQQWSALTFFDALASHHPRSVPVLWYRARCAERTSRSGSVSAQARCRRIYVESALPCIGRLTDVTAAGVSQVLLGFGWSGLALAVAAGDPDCAEEARRCAATALHDVPAWKWQALIQQSRADNGQGDFIAAADGIVRALIWAPDYWPCCEAFFSVFNSPRGTSRLLSQVAIRLALDTAEFLIAQPRWKQSPPELLVLKAQLKEAYLGKGDISSWDSVKEECQSLCVDAQKVLPGFAPAGDLLRRLERMEEVTLYMGAIFDDKYKVTATSYQRGSFGQVYRAELLEPVSGVKAVALKVIGGYADASSRRDRAHLLEREVRILKNLNHPNIAQYVGFVGNPLCLVMEWVDGQTVDALVRGKNRFPWQKVASIGYQIADALRHAKEVMALDSGVDEDFAHRDLHAGNIMIAQDTSGILKAKLLDFGLARLPGDSSTISSFVKKHGNAFMPYRDPYWPNGGILGDLFSFGIILFELTCGYRPYPDGALGEYQRSRKDPDDLLTQMRKIPPETSKDFGDILIKMLQPEIRKRYQRWEDLIRDLGKLSEPKRSALPA